MDLLQIDMNECPACKNKTLMLVKIFYPWKQAESVRQQADDG
jgi:hypothetical protein